MRRSRRSRVTEEDALEHVRPLDGQGEEAEHAQHCRDPDGHRHARDRALEHGQAHGWPIIATVLGGERLARGGREERLGLLLRVARLRAVAVAVAIAVAVAVAVAVAIAVAVAVVVGAGRAGRQQLVGLGLAGVAAGALQWLWPWQGLGPIARNKAARGGAMVAGVASTPRKHSHAPELSRRFPLSD
jgi:hypothetical protein